jgi:hypothetical protein
MEFAFQLFPGVLVEFMTACAPVDLQLLGLGYVDLHPSLTRCKFEVVAPTPERVIGVWRQTGFCFA